MINDSEEEKGPKDPVIALELFSANAVFNLIASAWFFYVAIFVIILQDANKADQNLATIIVAWSLCLMIVGVSGVALWIHLDGESLGKRPCHTCCWYIFCRDYRKIEEAASGWVILFSMFLVPSFVGLSIIIAIDVRTGRQFGEGRIFSEAVLFSANSMFLFLMGGFNTQKRLTFWGFYFPRFIVLLLTFFSRMAVVVRANINADSVSRELRTGYICMSVVMVVLGVFDGFRTKWSLNKERYLETRYQQLAFRYSTFVLSAVFFAAFLLELAVYLSTNEWYGDGFAQWVGEEWNVSLLLLRPLLYASAWMYLVIAFLPPKKHNKILQFALIDMKPYEVPWGDVAVATAASFDCYYDKKDDDAGISESASGPMRWRRKCYRTLEWIRNDTTDAHCIISEINSNAGLFPGDGWTLRPGDLIVAFRGTGSLSNAWTDLTCCKDSLPSNFLKPRYTLATDVVINDDNKHTVTTNSQRSCNINNHDQEDHKGRPSRSARVAAGDQKECKSPPCEFNHCNNKKKNYEDRAAGGEGEAMIGNKDTPKTRVHMALETMEKGESKESKNVSIDHKGLPEEGAQDRKNTILAAQAQAGGQAGDHKRLRGSIPQDNDASRARTAASDQEQRAERPGAGSERKTVKQEQSGDRGSGVPLSMSGYADQRQLPPRLERTITHWEIEPEEKRTAAQAIASKIGGLITNAAVHRGFLHHYLSIREEILNMVDPMLAPNPALKKESRHGEQDTYIPSLLRNAGRWLAGVVDLGVQEKPDAEKDEEIKHADELKRPSSRARPPPPPPTTLAGVDPTSLRNPKILVTGHSLGGALATLAALDLKTRYNNQYDVELINIASPRVGDRRFRQLIQKHLPDALRVVHDQDVIPTQPSYVALYEHIGHEAFVDSKGHVFVDRTPIEQVFFSGGRSSIAAHSFTAYNKGIVRHMLKDSNELFCRCLGDLCKRIFDEGFQEKSDAEGLAAAFGSVPWWNSSRTSSQQKRGKSARVDSSRGQTDAGTADIKVTDYKQREPSTAAIDS